MFGVLVVKKKDGTYGYIGAFSGKSPENEPSNKFVPSLFDDSIDDFFINKGMRGLTELSNKINNLSNLDEIVALKEKRKQKSRALQQRLFENYQFLNRSRKQKNLLDIFKDALNTTPPAAAGECAAPKLLQYAIEQHLTPIALTEFWWGKSIKTSDRKHAHFYPACKNKCRPILEFMLEDDELFDQRIAHGQP